MLVDNAISLKYNMPSAKFKSTIIELGIEKYPIVNIDGNLASLIDIPSNDKDYAVLFDRISTIYIECDGKTYFTSNEGIKEIILQHFRENIELRKEIKEVIKNRDSLLEQCGIDVIK